MVKGHLLMTPRHGWIWLSVLVAVYMGAAAHAELERQLPKLLPDDAETAHGFAGAIAVSGTIAIVGAPGDNVNGNNSGSAYVFELTTQKQLFKLLPNDGEAGDQFGGSVAVNGTIAVVGAPRDNDNGSVSGSAYIFDLTTGQQLFKLLADDGSSFDTFGRAVAISGAVAIIGAPSDDDAGPVSGSIYVFDVATGKQLSKLLASDGARDNRFGTSIAMSGTMAIVGAIFGDSASGSDNVGAAYVIDTTTGKELLKLLANDGQRSDFFGSSIAVSEGIAIIGAPFDDNNSLGAGSAYVFNLATGQQLFKLLQNKDDSVQGDNLGSSVAISGTMAIVGTPFGRNEQHESTGTVYVFDVTTGQQLLKLIPNDGVTGDRFGRSVAASKTTALISSGNANGIGVNSGSIYFFDLSPLPLTIVDLNGDGCVGAVDLGVLLGTWGLFGASDFNCDGRTGANDLALLLGSWGAGCS